MITIGLDLCTNELKEVYDDAYFFFFLTIFANDVTHTPMLVDSPEDK